MENSGRRRNGLVNLSISKKAGVREGRSEMKHGCLNNAQRLSMAGERTQEATAQSALGKRDSGDRARVRHQGNISIDLIGKAAAQHLGGVAGKARLFSERKKEGA